MAQTKPNFPQAQLQLQLFELRREARLREAREWFAANVHIESAEDVRRFPFGSRENASFRMVVGYWEQACALLRHGLLHEELFFETTSEFYIVWMSIRGAVADMRRQRKMPQLWASLEWAAKRYEKWMERRNPGALAAQSEFFRQMRTQAAAAKR